jgi:hypothetical protein
VIKSLRMRWAKYEVCMGEMRNVWNILIRKSQGKDHAGDKGIYGRVVLMFCVCDRT